MDFQCRSAGIQSWYQLILKALVPFTILLTAIYILMLSFCFSFEWSEDDDSEWDAHQNPAHPIGANGNADLAQSVVQVCYIMVVCKYARVLSPALRMLVHAIHCIMCSITTDGRIYTISVLAASDK